MLRTSRQSIAVDLPALDEALLHAKRMSCRRCGRTGMVIGHGFLMGYAEHGSERVVRGRRFVCSKRFRRSGCGRTFSVRIATVIAGFSVRTCTLSRMLLAVVSGICRKAAWERQGPRGLCLRSGYRLWRALLAAQSHLRTTLCARCPPPSCSDRRPLVQLLDHLRCVLGSTQCVLASFQHTFQRHLFG